MDAYLQTIQEVPLFDGIKTGELPTILQCLQAKTCLLYTSSHQFLGIILVLLAAVCDNMRAQWPPGTLRRRLHIFCDPVAKLALTLHFVRADPPVGIRLPI